jgi:hypothetical protein
VGGADFEIDPLFFHRGLNCLAETYLHAKQTTAGNAEKAE